MKINLIRKMQLFKNNLSFLLGMLKSFFSDIRFSEPNIRCFRLSFISRREKLFRHASSTDDESVCASSTSWRFAGGPVCSLAARSSPVASAAAVVHSSNSHCLAHTSFGALNSRRILWINDCCNDVQALISYGETKQTSKGIPPPTCYVVVQLISRANACQYHWRVNWKWHTQSWNLTLIDETGSVFSKHTSKPPIAR